jgi:hypothetical protein
MQTFTARHDYSTMGNTRTDSGEQQRRLLTRGKRVFAWSPAVVPSLLVLGGIVLLAWSSGAAHDVGIALLIVALLLMAVPSSPFLRARCAGAQLKLLVGRSSAYVWHGHPVERLRSQRTSRIDRHRGTGQENSSAATTEIKAPLR